MNKLLLSFCCILLIHTLKSQEIMPSQAAQGYLEGKNVTVEHSTGIFNYSVPLFEITSGNFTLPISLNYSGRGVKYSDNPGMIGYNWNLNIGGVVTRVIRGGMADEKYKGRARDYGSQLGPLEDDVKDVHCHERDGEHDLFTAVFNGKSINFIIQQESNQSYKVIPLERTNVKIEMGIHSGEISFFKVIDEDGVVYKYELPEWTCNISKMEINGRNGLYNKSYVSSWHLTSIEVPNGDPIVYHYDPDFSGRNKEENKLSHVERFSDVTEVTYRYGNPMIEKKFDFSNYAGQFQIYIDNAMDAALDEMLRNQVLAAINSIPNGTSNSYSDSFFNEEYFKNIENYQTNSMILGVLVGIASPGNSLLAASSTLVSLAASASSPTRDYLYMALDVLKEYALEEEEITRKTTSTFSAYRIFPPLLKSITCGYQKINIYHTNKHTEKLFVIDSMDFQYHSRPFHDKVLFERTEKKLLVSLKKISSNQNTYWKQDYEYYYLTERDNLLKSNYWGDFANQEYDVYWVDNPTCMHKSLRKIYYMEGGSIEINYESNTLPYYYTPDDYDIISYGGQRIKSIVLNDKNGGIDIIKYHYPLGGHTLFTDVAAQKVLIYNSFSDLLISSKMFLEGFHFFNMGNNGLFYPYVEEEHVGKGKNNFLFMTYPNHCYGANINFIQTSSLSGLLLAQGTYDNSGNLKYIKKYTYYWEDNEIFDYYNIPTMPGFHYREYFTSPTVELFYNKQQLQIKPNGFYMDKEKLEEENKNNVSVKYFTNGIEDFYFSPHRYYLQNILPRTTLKLEPADYYISYGGKIVPKKQEEFIFSGQISNDSNVEHLIGNVPSGGHNLSSTEFIYDRLAYHTNPTRIIKRKPDGEEVINTIYTALDFTNSSADFISGMKNKNMLTQPIKQQKLVKPAGSNKHYLLEENITLYQAFGENILPVENYSYSSMDIDIEYSHNTGQQSRLFSLNDDNYVLDGKLYYDYIKNRYLQTSTVTHTDSIRSQYDFYLDKINFKSDMVDPASIALINNYEDLTVPENLDISWEDYAMISKCLNVFKMFLDIDNSINREDYPDVFENNPFIEIELYDDFINGIKCIIDDHDYYAIYEKTGAFDFSLYAMEYWLMGVPEGFLFNNKQREDILECCSNFASYTWMNIYNVDMSFIADPNNFIVTGQYTPDYINVKTKGNKLFAFNALVKSTDNLIVNPNSIVSINGATRNLNLEPVQLTGGKWKLLKYTIDLSDHVNASELDVSVLFPGCSTLMAVLCPQDTSFEAISYMPDGKTFCTLDHNGMVQIMEYDDAGRLTRVLDLDGNDVERVNYNTINLTNN